MKNCIHTKFPKYICRKYFVLLEKVEKKVSLLMKKEPNYY